jgi:putative ABC transport system substrate-binding protein
MRSAAQSFAVALDVVGASAPDKINIAFAGIAGMHADGLVVLPDGMLFGQPAEIVSLAAAAHLPAVFPEKEVAEAGGLMAYGPSLTASFRRAAAYLDKILRGAKPADLPVEQPTKFEFVINLKTAKSLGLSVLPTLLATADEVIE